MRALVVVLSCALLLALAPLAAAQEQRGAIEGVIKDANGGVLPGVTVEARSPKLVGVATTVTDGTGAFRLPGLLPGTYELSATLSGFSAWKRADVPVELGRIVTLDITLAVGGVQETVNVSAEGGLIDVKQSAAFANLRADFIDKLPKGRDFTSVVSVAPGANDEVKSAGISIDGASGAENRYIMDGVDTTNLRTGVSGKNLITDVIDEVQVKSSGYNAEFGGATGGVVNIITKTGSNTYRGDAGLYFSSRGMEGAERPTLRLNPLDDTIGELHTYRQDPFTRWEPVLTLGGPIVRDHVVFFTSFAPQIERTQRTVTFLSTGQTATFTRQDRTFYSTSNVTAQVGAKTRLKFAVSVSPYYRYGTLPLQDGTANPDQDWAHLDNRAPNITTSGSADLILTPNFYVAVRGGYFANDNVDLNVPNVVRREFRAPNLMYPEIPADLRHANLYANVPTNMASMRDKMSRLSLNTDATRYAHFAGNHTFKAGIQFDRIFNDVLNGEQQPRVRYYWDRTYTTLSGERVRGTYGYYVQRQFVTTGRIHSNNVGLFVQDAWAVTPRLTLNVGLRTEREEVPSYKAGNPGIEFGFKDKLAPRTGFAYDVKGDGRWKLYGSWGIFYDITKLEMPRGSLGGDHWIDYYYTLDTYRWDQIGAPGCDPPLTSACAPNYPGTFIEQSDMRHASNDPALPRIDPNLKPMKSQEMSVGFDHEINPTTSIGMRYVRKWLNRTIEDVGVIDPDVGEIYFIANPGEGVGAYVLGPDYPPDPRAKRDYDSVEFRLRKRLAQRWQLNASYTWSRLYGNYSGLATTDELTMVGDNLSGRSSPNVNRFFDAPYMCFDDTGRPVYGVLGTDRPHYVKGQVLYNFPFGTTVGVSQMVASGTPTTRQVSMVSSTPVFYMGRNSDGRTPVLSQTNLSVQHDVALGRNKKVAIAVNVLNLFDQNIATNYYTDEVLDNIGITDAAFFSGFNVQQLIAEQDIRRDPRFLMANMFQGRRAVRVNAKFTF